MIGVIVDIVGQVALPLCGRLVAALSGIARCLGFGEVAITVYATDGAATREGRVIDLG